MKKKNLQQMTEQEFRDYILKKNPFAAIANYKIVKPSSKTKKADNK